MFKFEERTAKTVYLINFNGFNKQKGYDFDNRILEEYDIDLKNVNFRFYFQNRLISKDTCNKENFKESFFGYISGLNFMDDIIYDNDICPFVFAHTNLKQLALTEIANSLLFKNQLRFLDLNENETNSSSIDLYTSRLKVLTLNVAYEKLDHHLLNVYVFKNLKILALNGIIYEIEYSLFKSFSSLRAFILNPSDLGSFYQHDSLKWMSSLNFDLKKVNLSNSFEIRLYKSKAIIVQIFETKSYFTKIYSYPDEDFCVFKNFPHEKLVYPSIVFAEDEFKCTCSLYYLIQYYKFYLNDNLNHYDIPFYGSYTEEFFKSPARNCLKTVNLKNEIEKCNFQERLGKCNLTETNKEFPFRGNIHSFFVFEWLKYIIQVYLQTLFCILSLFTNFFTLLVVRKRTIPLDRPMYRHVYFNSIFNLFFCLFTLISLINICIFPTTSFCSSIMTKQFSQYFKIYMIYFLANCLRLMSNISYIFFSLSRFFLATSLSNKFSEKFEKLNLKKFYLLLFIICLSFSSFKIFEYRINNSFDIISKQNPFDIYEIAFCVYDLYFSKTHLYRCKIFQILNLINNSLNNIVTFILNVLVDVFLLKYIKDIIKKKSQSLGPEQTEANLSHTKKVKKKITLLLIFDGFFYFLTHIPAFGVTVWLIADKDQLSEFCYWYFPCPEIIDMAQAFELIFISFQFFILLKLDNNFGNEFYSLIHLKKETQH